MCLVSLVCESEGVGSVRWVCGRRERARCVCVKVGLGQREAGEGTRREGARGHCGEAPGVERCEMATGVLTLTPTNILPHPEPLKHEP